MDINKLLKITDMYAKTNWRKYFDEDASPAVHQYLTQNGDRLYPWILKIIISINMFKSLLVYSVSAAGQFNQVINNFENQFYFADLRIGSEK